MMTEGESVPATRGKTVMTVSNEETPEERERRLVASRERNRRYRAKHPDKAAQSAQRIKDKRHALKRAADPEWVSRFCVPNEAPGALRGRIDREKLDGRVNLGDLTVLTLSKDPYRMHTVANHRDAAWFKEHLKKAGVFGTIHLRGFHYRLVARGDITLPSGKPYINDETCCNWLNQASKPARWLEYIGFDRIVDNRNDPPVIRVADDLEPRNGEPRIGSGDPVPYIYGANFLPKIEIDDDNLVQPYRVILAGEKSSLREELEPLVDEIGGELILPSGEFSDTLIYDFVRRAADDGRPAVVIYFSDFDPSGNQMPVSVSRKIQALVDLKFPDLQIELHHAALTTDHVRRLNLPSTPLKDGEQRADRWRDAQGQEQTEIDALMALHPGELRRIAREAVAPFYDFDVADRLEDARNEWEEEANEALEADPAYAVIRTQIETATATVQAGLREIRLAQQSAREIDVVSEMPRFEMPECEPDGERPEPLFDSQESWLDQTRRLKEKRNLSGDDGDDDDDE
jgi:hypothetical protein